MLLATVSLVALMNSSAATHRTDLGIAGDAAEIRKVVSGRSRVSAEGDVLKFGPSRAGSSGTFERTGRPAARYAIGYATLLVSRNSELHGHVIVVWPEDEVLHFGGQAYRCGPVDAE
jgi:hypothetical protein